MSEFMALNDLKQYNLIENHQSKTLDLVLSSDLNVSVVETDDALTPIDNYHPPLEILLNINSRSYLNPIQRPRYNFYKADYATIEKDLDQINWMNSLSSCINVDEMVSRFYEILQFVIDKSVPMTKPKSNRYPVWYSRGLIRSLKEKHRARIRFKKYGNPMDKIVLDLLKNRTTQLMQQCFSNYCNSLEKGIAKNPKHFWAFIKHQRNCKSSIPSDMHLDDENASDVNDVNNLFAKHFSSIYTENALSQTTNIPSIHVSDSSSLTLNTVVLHENDVLNKLKRLNLSKGPGPDGLPAILLTRCAKQLSFPLTFIFNESLRTGQFPNYWRTAKIVPIHKDGPKNIIKNYRPISILSILPKIFESLIYPHLTYLVKSRLNDQQHGFIQKRSTNTNLVAFTDAICCHLDQGTQVDAVYTDFSKAFDKVDHDTLLLRLADAGVGGSTLPWFKSYLNNRRSYVVIDGVESFEFNITSGVPQGSHLGPLLFLILVNSISECFQHTTAYLFADDLKILKPIKHSDDCRFVQDDINRIVKWCEHNKMILNVDKCSYISFSRNKTRIQASYTINNQPLKQVECIRDLGVLLDNKLTFNAHLDKIIEKGSRMCGFIARNSKSFKLPTTKIILFNSLVRSTLEYCSQVWSPHYEVHKNRIERTQRRFLSYLTYNTRLHRSLNSYKSRLEHFKITSLYNRRKLLDLAFLHKIVNNKIDCPELLTKINISAPSRLPRSSVYKLFTLRRYKTNLGLNSPITRMTKSYNDLSRLLDLDIYGDTFPSFKKKLKDYLGYRHG